MTARTVQVQQRTTGIGRPADPPDPVFLHLLEERLTVATLIRRTVEEQVRDLTQRPNLDAWVARQTLDAWYPEQPGTAPADGTDVACADAQPATTADAEPDVLRFFTTAVTRPLDAERECARALRAFDAGSFLVLVDGRQAEHL